MRKTIFTMLTALLFTSGAWADDFSAANIVANSGAGTTKNHVKVSSPGTTSTTNANYAKISGTQKKRDMVAVEAKATSGALVENKIIAIKADRGYKLVSPIKINGSSSSTSDIKMVYVGWEGQPAKSFQLCNGATDWKFDKTSITSEPADKEITFSTTIRNIYLYTQIKTATEDYDSFGTSKTVGSGTKGYVYKVTATAELAPEIEGDNQMYNDETITLTGYPSGGTWAIVSGPGTIDSDGKLTANGNGTIRVSYTKDAVAVTKDIVSGVTKDYTWTFDTKDVMPTTFGVTPVKSESGASYESAGQIKLGSNGAYLYIDVEDYIITKAKISAKVGTANKKFDVGSFKSAKVDNSITGTSNENYVIYQYTPSKVSTVFAVIKNSETSAYIGAITLTIKRANKQTLTWNFDGGASSETEGADYTADGQVAEGATITYPSNASMSKDGYVFDGWSSSATEMPTSGLTITAQWIPVYTVTYTLGDGASGTPTETPKKEGDKFNLHNGTTGITAPEGKVFSKWKDQDNDEYAGGAEYTMPAKQVTLTAQWITSYAITKGTHTNGDFTVSKNSAAEGDEITLTATPDENYLFDSWNVYKTGESSTKVSVSNNKFTMPAYAVTVSATFTSDARAKVLYVTSDGTVKADDKVYAALAEEYNVHKRIYSSSTTDVTAYALVVFHESIGGTNYGTGLVKAAIEADVPILNTKSYFYNSGRWNWGTPNAGTSVTGATLNNYSNIADHPLFDGVTITDGFITLFSEAKAKAMQPVDLVDTKKGYTLATTPAASGQTGVTCIHELSAADRGLTGGATSKYLMISIGNENGCFELLTENGKKLIKNAAAYLMSDESWTPTSISANIGSTGWGTIVSTEALDFTSVSTLNAYLVTDHVDDQVTLVKMASTVPAKTPLLISGATANIPIAASSSTVVSANKLKAGTGAIVAKADEKTKYVLAAVEDVATFLRINETSATVPVGKAYLEFDEVIAGAPALRIVEENQDATGIDDIEANEKAVKFIENGRILIKKNGIVYDALGRIVK